MLEDHSMAMDIWKGKVVDNYEKNKANYIRYKQPKIAAPKIISRRSSIKRIPKKQSG